MVFLSLTRRRLAAVSLALVALTAASAPVWAAPSRDNLTLLIPDNAALNSWQVQVWTDAAAEEGIQIKTITDSAFLALGSTASAKIAGLVMPDSAHIQASNALVAAVKQYVSSGGKLMLTYDAGALNDLGFYDASGKSRFSDMVGVDYVQYETLRERVVGFGPIVGSKARLTNLLVPPGKYLPYVAPTAAAATTAFVPTSRLDPGGAEVMRPMVEARTRRSWSQPFNPLRYDQRVAAATPSMYLPSSYPYRYSDDVGATVDSTGSYWQEKPTGWVSTQLTEDDKSLQTISGYGFPALSYYYYVTTGTFPGNVFLSSPEHGLVAGERSYGNGKVLFVNIPLGYFTAIGTDGMLLHGFLNHFARDQVVMPQISVQPKGVGGLVYDWHVDDGQALIPDYGYVMGQWFMQGKGPFSVQFTAGPDVSVIGDGLGMNLANNPAGQAVVRAAGAYRGSLTNEVGAHGGWIHNIFGINANETNADTYLPWVQANVGVVQNIMGKKSREYSAPQGNNPLWATKWLETYGIVGMYTVSNTGTAATREWRSGARVTNKLWAMPISPLGTTATFEEFDEKGITNGTSAQWLLDLQSFVVNNRTNRLFYNHPPGARDHLNVVKTFVQRAEGLKNWGRFNWYTMAQIADFNQRRIQTTWSSNSYYGYSRFTASNPDSLTDITWLLPRSRYGYPYVTSGWATVDAYDDTNWIVTARGGNNLSFKAYER
ncbi:hypothetical protein os1_41230 [Comamonadaceae bacterium OS-1]|nr:hypothetical protein os1_41230 [Comamonadaceae bacterium OS-1]